MTRAISMNNITDFTIDGNFAIDGNYHEDLDFDWLLSHVTMVVAIDVKVTINGKFYATGTQINYLLELERHYLCVK